MLGKIRFLIKKNIYIKRNKNNSTWMVNYFNIDKVKIGKKTWGGVQVIDYELNKTKNRISIGDYCSIASEVKFMLGGNHRIDRISTFLYKQSGFFQDFSSNGENLVDKGGIEIGNDVWIGYGCLILPGTNIGQGCIIGANSIVAGNVPPYSVYVGNKVIKKRFSDNIIQKLLLVDYNNFDQKVECFPKEMEKYLYSELDEKCLDEFLDFINGKNIK